MVANPEVQSRAHEELDRVVGRQRLPVFEDLEQLPFIRAFVSLLVKFSGPVSNVSKVMETFRLHPVDPIGLPHSLSEVFLYPIRGCGVFRAFADKVYRIHGTMGISSPKARL